MWTEIRSESDQGNFGKEKKSLETRLMLMHKRHLFQTVF